MRRKRLKTQTLYVLKKLFYALSVIALFTTFVSCQNVAYLNKFGDVDVAMGNYDEAIVDYTHAINYKPTDPDGYLGRGYAYQMKGNMQMAIADYSKAISLAPGDPYIYLIRGMVYALNSNDQQAVIDFTSAITLDPTNKKAYLNRAESYDRMGEKDKSVADYQRAALLGNAKAQSVLMSKGIRW